MEGMKKERKQKGWDVAEGHLAESETTSRRYREKLEKKGRVRFYFNASNRSVEMSMLPHHI